MRNDYYPTLFRGSESRFHYLCLQVRQLLTYCRFLLLRVIYTRRQSFISFSMLPFYRRFVSPSIFVAKTNYQVFLCQHSDNFCQIIIFYSKCLIRDNFSIKTKPQICGICKQLIKIWSYSHCHHWNIINILTTIIAVNSYCVYSNSKLVMVNCSC